MKAQLFSLIIALLFISCTENKETASTITSYGPGHGVSPDSVRKIAREAWIYGYPMFYNYRSMYLYALDKKYPDYAGGFNRFRHYNKTFTWADTTVATPNGDTPYSWAILDLS